MRYAKYTKKNIFFAHGGNNDLLKAIYDNNLTQIAEHINIKKC